MSNARQQGEKMSILEQGQLRGTFRGFRNRQTYFEFYGGGVWRQNEYKYNYFYAYMPDAKVVDEGGKSVLHVGDMDDSVEVVRARKSDMPDDA
jgi:hypothetical protein